MIRCLESKSPPSASAPATGAIPTRLASWKSVGEYVPSSARTVNPGMFAQAGRRKSRGKGRHLSSDAAIARSAPHPLSPLSRRPAACDDEQTSRRRQCATSGSVRCGIQNPRSLPSILEGLDRLPAFSRAGDEGRYWAPFGSWNGGLSSKAHPRSLLNVQDAPSSPPRSGA